jgi:phage-related protein
VPSKYLRDTGRVVEGVGGEVEEGEDTIPNLPEFAEAPRYQIEYKNKWWIECYSPEHPEFFFNTSNLGMSLIEKPIEQLPIMKVDATEEISFDGDIIESNATYSTTEIEMEFYIKKENYNVVMAKLRQLCQLKEFRLTCGWDNRYYKKARLSSNIEVEEENHDEIGYRVVLEFILQPYRYALDGTKFAKNRKTGKDEFIHDSEIYNNYSVSYPKIYIQVPHKSLVESNINNEKIITIAMYSTIDDVQTDLSLYAHNESYNGKAVKYLNLVVDCENEVVYEDTTNKNYNHLLPIDIDFPILKPKLTKVWHSTSLVNNNCQVKIVPNWREF